MSEQEMLQEIERLRRELQETRQERDNLHRSLCHMLPTEEIQLTEDDLRQMREGNHSITELLQDPRFADDVQASGAAPTTSVRLEPGSQQCLSG